MHRYLGNKVALTCTLACAALVASLAGEHRAEASFIDAGIEAGIAKRSLGGTDYKTAFAWQLHAELALIPPILMVGPFVTFSSAKPDAAGDPAAVPFRTIGLRAKLKIPIPGGFKPYAVAGIGWTHSNFEDVKVCGTFTYNGVTANQCQNFPNANANFVEMVLGAGFMIDIAGPLAFTAEFNWRPATGYKNDEYQKAADQAANGGAAPTSRPDPSRNGVVYTVMGGLALSL
jgi:opacity protein-like surface antigen